MTYVISPASDTQSQAVLDLVLEAAAWLAARVSDQWQYPPAVHARTICRDIGRGYVWLVENAAGTAVATATLNDYADPEFWTARDDPGSALYVHRMVVRRAEAGNELGSAMLDWASRRATDAAKQWLRLDAWSSSIPLHRYYLDHGFHQVRTLHLHHRGSGALFQRRASVQLERGPPLAERPHPR